MFQRFHENTQISRVIKNILSTEPVPLLQTVKDGTPLLERCRYLYRGKIIECDESGKLQNNFHVITDADPATCIHRSSVAWYDDATHKYLGNYLRYLRDTHNLDLMPYYNCYNATELTDVYLDTYGSTPLVCSNLKLEDGTYKVTPSSKLSCGVQRGGSTYKFGFHDGYKVVAIPAKFDTTYTFAVESHGAVSLRGIIYNNRSGMIQEYKIYPEQSSVTYYSDYLNHTCKTLPSSKFQEPFTHRVELASCDLPISELKKRELYARQEDLYIVLQLPASVDSSIVVLEGDYTQRRTEVTVNNFFYNKGMELVKEITDKIKIETNPSTRSELTKLRSAVLQSVRRDSTEDVRMKNLQHQLIAQSIPETSSYSVSVKYPDNLSLLYYNTGVSYAFSDRLIEYLLLNVVTELETLPTNILRVQTSLGNLYPKYKDSILRKDSCLGVWDDSINKYIKFFVFENLDKVIFPMDHDGYVNKDVEALLSQKGVYVT